jgi:ABC-type enterochelin transport system permease subunit
MRSTDARAKRAHILIPVAVLVALLAAVVGNWWSVGALVFVIALDMQLLRASRADRRPDQP